MRFGKQENQEASKLALYYPEFKVFMIWYKLIDSNFS